MLKNTAEGFNLKHTEYQTRPIFVKTKLVHIMFMVKLHFCMDRFKKSVFTYTVYRILYTVCLITLVYILAMTHENYKCFDTITIDQKHVKKLSRNFDRSVIIRGVLKKWPTLYSSKLSQSANRAFLIEKSFREYKGDVCIQNHFPFLRTFFFGWKTEFVMNHNNEDLIFYSE